MKLITAIAALALLAGSMDVEAQKRGKVGLPGDSDDDAPQIAPVAHLAIGAFSQLDPEERKDLAEAAKEGDEGALEELRTDGMEATEAMIEALGDEDAREMIKLGMLLGGQTFGSWTIENCSYCNSKAKAEFARGETASDSFTGQVGVEVLGIFSHADDFMSADLDERLDMVEEQLEAQLESLGEVTGGNTSNLSAKKKPQ